MRTKVSIVASLIGVAYFTTYFFSAERVDGGENKLIYFVTYRIGSVSLNRLAPLFEPARRLDNLLVHQHQDDEGVILWWKYTQKDR